MSGKALAARLVVLSRDCIHSKYWYTTPHKATMQYTPPPPSLSFDCNSMPSIPPSACIVGRVECSRTHVGSAAAACCGLGPDRRCRSLMETAVPRQLDRTAAA